MTTRAQAATSTSQRTLLTDGSIQLWTVSDDGQLTGPSQLVGPTGVATSVTFSARGTLAAFYEDGTIHLWSVHDPAAPATLATISGLPNPTTVAWEPGTQVVMGAASDGTLLTWDTDPAAVARRLCASPLAAQAQRLSPSACPARLADERVPFEVMVSYPGRSTVARWRESWARLARRRPWPFGALAVVAAFAVVVPGLQIAFVNDASVPRLDAFGDRRTGSLFLDVRDGVQNRRHLRDISRSFFDANNILYL